jgi:hypothetical protein
VNRGSPSMVNMLRMFITDVNGWKPKLSTVSTCLKMGCIGGRFRIHIFDAVSRNVIIPTSKVLTQAVDKIKTDSSGWPDLQVPRSGLVRVYCFYMF